MRARQVYPREGFARRPCVGILLYMQMNRGWIVPVALVLASLIILIGAGYAGLQFQTSPEQTPQNVQDVADILAQGSGTQSAGSAGTSGARLIWSNVQPNITKSFTPPHAETNQVITIGPANTLLFRVLAGTQTTITLIDPLGNVLKPSKETTTQSVGKTKVSVKKVSAEDGKTTSTTITVANNKAAGNWTVVLSNEGDTPDPYTIEVPVGAPPISVSPGLESVAAAPQKVIITLQVEQSGGGNSTPVGGVTVVAHITNPNQEVTLITLTENAPGEYVGVYNGAANPGTYEITYTIQGTSSHGTDFIQTTIDTFYVPPNATSTTPIIFGKKFDINRSGQIDIIGY